MNLCSTCIKNCSNRDGKFVNILKCPNYAELIEPKEHKINCYRFQGWVIECPYCQYKQYVGYDKIAFDPEDDLVHIVQCEQCKSEFEIKDR